MSSWRSEFYEFMNEEKWDSNDMKLLLEKNHPEKLYKYKEVNEYTLSMIKDNIMWASNPRSFNDPYDCALDFDYDVLIKNKIRKEFNVPDNIIDDKLNHNEEIKKKLCNKIKNDIDKIVDDMAIVCLSEEKDNILMWSHYAKYHQGICIEYDFRDISKYTEVYPIVYMRENFDLSESFIDINPSVIQRKVMIKSVLWEYEKEWRIIFNNSNPKTNGGVICFPRIKSIYLGCKISKDDKEKIIKLAKEKKISIYQMKMEKNKFKLAYDKIY